MSYETDLLSLVPAQARDADVRRPSFRRRVNRPSAELSLRRWGKAFQPFLYQREIIEGIQRRIATEGNQIGLLSLPTGSGKTITAAYAVLALARPIESATVWVAPQRELLYQASAALQSAWSSGAGPPSMDVRIIERSADFQAHSDVPTCYLMTPSMALK